MIRVHYLMETGEYQLGIAIGGTENSITINEDDATKLVRDLVRTGVEIATDKELALTYKLEATERHLDDMRRLVLLENDKGEV